MNRRAIIFMMSAVALRSTRTLAAAFEPQTQKDLQIIQADWRALLDPRADVASAIDPIRKSKNEWRMLLSKEQYAVLRDRQTERPGSSPLDGEKRPGVFACAGCSLPLFTSEMKYDSRTGWPSFFTAIPRHLVTQADFLLAESRTEYHCVRCGGHQGHLFDDGPRPTLERWCNNGVALRFIPLSSSAF